MENETKEMLKELLINKKEQLQVLIRKSKELIGIDQESGEPLILVPRSKLTDRQYLGLYLLGKYFSHELGLKDSSSATIQELSKKLNLEYQVVGSRLSELKREKKTRTITRGTYEIDLHNAIEFLDEIQGSMGRGKNDT